MNHGFTTRERALDRRQHDMTGNGSGAIVNRRTVCAACDSRHLDTAVELPRLPLTGLFSTEPNRGPIERFEQRLLLCRQCGHGQLENQIDPQILYGSSYSFRTSASATGRAGTDHFISFLARVAGAKHFKCALDLGCNDLHLLQCLENRALSRVGIDPIWAGREEQNRDPSIAVIGATVAAADLSSRLPERHDLVLCRHTLEHIYDPFGAIQTVFDLAAEGALFVVEVPGFDALVRRFRFDQVFHQHLQYFHLRSFLALIKRIGATFIASCENYHDWGALLIAFEKRSSTGDVVAAETLFTIGDIRKRYAAFKHDMEQSGATLQTFSADRLYGYGAAQMLPVLAYSMESDLAMLESVLDDDPAKQGLYYQNLPLKIQSPAVADLESATVFISAVDNVKPILLKLLATVRPRHILYPLHII